jgi:hypothetical protein
VPNNAKQLKAFVGLTGFYRTFVLWFSLIASLLHKLTGKNLPYVWGKEQAKAFQTLKDILCSEPHFNTRILKRDLLSLAMLVQLG